MMPMRITGSFPGQSPLSGIVGLVLALAGMFMLPLPVAMPAAAEIVGGQVPTMEICSEGGARTVDIGDSTPPPEDCSCQLCLCCLPGHGKAVPLPYPIPVGGPVPRVVDSLTPGHGTPHMRAGRFWPRPRGPPESERNIMALRPVATHRDSVGADTRIMGVAA